MELRNVPVHRLAATTFGAAGPSPPALPFHPCRACHHFLLWSRNIVVLRGRALVQIARLWRCLLQNTESSLGSLHGFCGGHVAHPVWIVPGSEAGTPPGSAGRPYDPYRRETSEASS